MDTFEHLCTRYFQYLEERGPLFNGVLAFISTVAIGVFDMYAPDEAAHTLLYIIPIAFVTWFSGFRYGLFIMICCVTLWSINNIASSPIITLWNIFSTLAFFTSIVGVLQKTRKLWENEKTLARTDPLTGVKNLRAFSELVDYEMKRSQRDKLPFALAYLDIDNFKQINDSYGHAAGDELLKSIVTNIGSNLRKTDIIGRLGGDEFAIFFPETDQPSARVVMLKVVNELSCLMEHLSMPTTFSTGVVTCSEGVHDLEKLISYADNIMYRVKRGGKNDIQYAVYPRDVGP